MFSVAVWTDLVVMASDGRGGGSIEEKISRAGEEKNGVMNNIMTKKIRTRLMLMPFY